MGDFLQLHCSNEFQENIKEIGFNIYLTFFRVSGQNCHKIAGYRYHNAFKIISGKRNVSRQISSDKGLAVLICNIVRKLRFI